MKSETKVKKEWQTDTSMFQLDVLEVIDNPDGTATVQLDVSDEFIEWFKEDQGLKRWSQKRLRSGLFRHLKRESKRQKIAK